MLLQQIFLTQGSKPRLQHFLHRQVVPDPHLTFQVKYGQILSISYDPTYERGQTCLKKDFRMYSQIS